MAFHLEAFKRAWREKCAQHGIDPVEGATGYQVANLLAERRKAAPKSDWWTDDDAMWYHAPPYRSYVEELAVWLVYDAAREAIYQRQQEGKRRCVRRRMRVRS
jgi:hypothetical protein